MRKKKSTTTRQINQVHDFYKKNGIAVVLQSARSSKAFFHARIGKHPSDGAFSQQNM